MWTMTSHRCYFSCAFSPTVSVTVISDRIGGKHLYVESFNSKLPEIEHSGAPHASRPPRHLRSRGLPSWTGNSQLASSRSSTPPARFGRATDAAGPAHHGFGSSPIGVPIGDAVRRIRRRTPCVCVCVCACVCVVLLNLHLYFWCPSVNLS